MVGARGEDLGEGERAGGAAPGATGCNHTGCAAMQRLLASLLEGQ